jgi:tRNA dimethylallyltransferase
MCYNLLIVLGPTASGKTRLGVQLAEILNGEIISADSRQVYRGMDIGTGKDLGEYGRIPYHLIDIVDPGSEFNVFRFQGFFIEAFEAIKRRGCLPILVGGTGMYLDSVLLGYRMVEVPENSGLRTELEGLSMEDLSLRFKIIRPKHHKICSTVIVWSGQSKSPSTRPKYRQGLFLK